MPVELNEITRELLFDGLGNPRIPGYVAWPRAPRIVDGVEHCWRQTKVDAI
ncbi:MAG TPA: hypothetical protein VMJ31_06115 [Methylocystis sp.]|nr:hypothetical protein [Methylocystis sp.]